MARHPHNSSTPGDTRDPSELYLARVARFRERRDEFLRRARLISHARFAVVLILIGLIVWAFSSDTTLSVGLVVLGVVLTAAFVVLVLMHDRVDARVRWYDGLRVVNREAAARVVRDWNALPMRHDVDAIEDDHPYARDLDVAGHASLLQLFGIVSTPPGRGTLQTWLLAPAGEHIVSRRQDAAKELAPKLEWRHQLAVRARQIEILA